MARFLFCPVPEAGDVYPTVPVASALASRGHEVVYLTSSDFESVVRNHGFGAHITPAGVYGNESAYGRTPTDLSPRHLEAQVQTLERIFRVYPADVLVDGAFPFGPRLFAELHGIPRASFHSGCYPIPTEDLLFPFGPGQLPPADEQGRSMARLARLIQDERERDEVAAWDAIRASIGLPASRVHPVQASASSDLVLIARPPALEYPRTDLPPQFWFVGPLTWEPFTPMPGRVADLAPEPPIVYVSQGATYNRNPVILKLAVRALVDEPVQMVVTTVRPFVASEFEPFPENAVIERFVPFSRLLDRISLVVSHGGAGAVHAALSRGIPVIILPFTADQFEVAARCEWRGVGIRLDPWKCTPEQLRSAVRTILSDASYRDRAHRIRESCAAIDGPQLACELLERLAATRSPVHRPTTAFNPWAEEVSYEHTVRAN